MREKRFLSSAIAASVLVLAGCSSGGATGSDSGDSGTSDTGTTDSGASTDGSLAQDGASSSDGAPSSDAHADAERDASDAAVLYTTAAGCPLPGHGWTLKVSDQFGTGGNVGNFAALHSKYYEAQFYNRDSQGLVLIPNVVINNEQETYSHFEDVVAFASDHLTIQGRGQPDGAITSAEMVSRYTARSFCVEGKYVIPSASGSWPAFWLYGSTSNSDSSEIDVEQPITPNQGVHDDVHELARSDVRRQRDAARVHGLLRRRVGDHHALHRRQGHLPRGMEVERVPGGHRAGARRVHDIQPRRRR